MSTTVSSTSTVLLYFIAIFLPPVAVFLVSACSADLLINICLTILGWIPGVLHAWYAISKRERPVGVTGSGVGSGTTREVKTSAAPTATTSTGPARTTAPGTTATTY